MVTASKGHHIFLTSAVLYVSLEDFMVEVTFAMRKQGPLCLVVLYELVAFIFEVATTHYLTNKSLKLFSYVLSSVVQKFDAYDHFPNVLLAYWVF